MEAGDAPLDWYRSSFGSNTNWMLWEEGAEETLQLALEMLEPKGTERVLDLACATGRRTLELCRRGFEVIGVDVSADLLGVGGGEADLQNLYPYFVQVDPRELLFEDEFDLALSLGGGAFGHFDLDTDDVRAFAAVARALRPGGRLLMQLPNVLHVEADLPPKTWLTGDADGEETAHLIEQLWNPATHRIDGTLIPILPGEALAHCEPVPFQRRLHSIDELAEALATAGLQLADVFDEDGERCVPSGIQQQLFVEARL